LVNLSFCFHSVHARFFCFSIQTHLQILFISQKSIWKQHFSDIPISLSPFLLLCQTYFFYNIFTRLLVLMYFYPSTTKLPTPKMKQHVQHIPNPFSTILYI
jgi:hypothetical protein